MLNISQERKEKRLKHSQEPVVIVSGSLMAAIYYIQEVAQDDPKHYKIVLKFEHVLGLRPSRCILYHDWYSLENAQEIRAYLEASGAEIIYES